MSQIPLPDDVIAALEAERGDNPDDLFGRLAGRYSALIACALAPPNPAAHPPLPNILRSHFSAALEMTVRNHVAPHMLSFRATRRAVADYLTATNGLAFIEMIAQPSPRNILATIWRQCWLDSSFSATAGAPLGLSGADMGAVASFWDMPIAMLRDHLYLLTLTMDQDARGVLSPGFLLNYLGRLIGKDMTDSLVDLCILASIARSACPAPQWLPWFLKGYPSDKFPLLHAYWAGHQNQIMG